MYKFFNSQHFTVFYYSNCQKSNRMKKKRNQTAKKWLLFCFNLVFLFLSLLSHHSFGPPTTLWLLMLIVAWCLLLYMLTYPRALARRRATKYAIKTTTTNAINAIPTAIGTISVGNERNLELINTFDKPKSARKIPGVLIASQSLAVENCWPSFVWNASNWTFEICIFPITAVDCSSVVKFNTCSLVQWYDISFGVEKLLPTW